MKCVNNLLRKLSVSRFLQIWFELHTIKIDQFIIQLVHFSFTSSSISLISSAANPLPLSFSIDAITSHLIWKT